MRAILFQSLNSDSDSLPNNNAPDIAKYSGTENLQKTEMYPKGDKKSLIRA